MKKSLLAFPLIGILAGCPPGLNPLGNIAEKLDVKVDSIDPHLRLQIPLSRSSLDITINLSVQSSAPVNVIAQSFSGTLGLEQQGSTHPVTDIKISKKLEIPAKGRASIPISLSLKHDDVKNSWDAISRAAREKSATWKLDGKLHVESHGVSAQIPVHATKKTGM
jgi:hypothetical protein